MQTFENDDPILAAAYPTKNYHRRLKIQPWMKGVIVLEQKTSDSLW
jgi:hypothetical protein